MIYNAFFPDRVDAVANTILNKFTEEYYWK